MHGISIRRTGLVLSAILCLCLVSANAYARMGGGGGMGGGGCGCGGGGGGGGSTVIDPPVSGPFVDPPLAVNKSTVPGIVEVDLIAMKSRVSVNGTTANLMTYNGSFPGPTIRVKKNDTLRINFTNGLPSTTATNILGFQKNITNLHTHGFHVSPNEPSDFVMYDLMPGQTYHHEYNLAYQNPGTLNLYHPHRHGVSAEQYWAGLVGGIVVDDEVPALSGYETHLMVLKDIALSGSEPAPHSTMMDYMHGKEGNIVMVNGKVNPRLNIKKGQVQRWRILNASNARFYKISLQNHSMYLVGTDGGLLDKPHAQSYFILSPGERIDVLVKGTQSSGSYKLQALPYARMGMSGGQTVTLMTMTYSGSQSAQSIPSVIDPSAVRLNPNNLPIMKHQTFELSMGMGRGYINGQDFDENPFMHMSHLGTYEIWTIVNNSGMDHPFHQHVNPAMILSVTGGDPAYASLYTSIPAWKDTVLVPKNGSVTMLVPVMDFSGMAMFHCHILEHEDIGMMGHWHIMDMMDMEMPM